MRILGLPSDIGDPRQGRRTEGEKYPIGACGCYRISWPLEALERAGYAEVEWGAYSLPYAFEFAREYDLVVLQRQTDPYIRNFVRHCRRLLGIGVVFDFDDDLLNLEEVNPSYVHWGTDRDAIWSIYQRLLEEGNVDPRIAEQWTPQLAWQVAHERRAGLKQVLSEASLVTVTTSYLETRYSKYTEVPIRVLPNAIQTEGWRALKPERPAGSDDYLMIGWAGGDSHKRDIAVVMDGLIAVLERHDGVALAFIGIENIKGLFPEHLRNRVFVVPWMAIEEYRNYVAGFDIGIAPSVDCPTNRGKSGIRIYELAVAKSGGMPIVASPVPYADDVHEGMGLVAHSAADFRNALGWMIQNTREARQMGQRLHDHVLAEHTYSAQVDLWHSAYESLL